MGSLLAKSQQQQQQQQQPQRVEPHERTASGPGTNGPQLESTAEVQRGRYAPSKWDVYMLGVTIVLGGQYFSWNAGLAAGLYSYLIAYFLIAGAYIMLCCCTSEVAGALPFAGGAYGLSRCTLGFFPGYLIGCCEALEYIAYVAASVISLAQMIVEAAPSLEGLEPAIALAFYVSALCIHTRSDRRVFWVFNMALGSTSLLIVALYCLGSLPFVSFAKNAVSDPTLRFVDGFAGFMRALPLAAWFFVGVEALSLASDEVAQPKVAIPFAQIACVLTLFASGIAVFFVTVSLPPGLASLPTELTPFNSGFALLFHTSQRFATILSIPATYATAYGFMWCYGKLIAAMAQSRLLPPYCGKRPYAGIYCGSVMSYLICLLVHFCPRVGTYLFSVGIMCAFMSYTGQCLGYLSLRFSYRNIKSSSFRNPFGVVGAIYSMSVWLLAIVAIACFQGNGGVEILAFGCIVMVLAVYYCSYAKKRQTFSAQENRILLVAHVMKFNGRRAAAATSALKRKKDASSARYRSNLTTKGGTANNTSTHSTGPAPAVVLGSSRPLKATSRVAAGGPLATAAASSESSDA